MRTLIIVSVIVAAADLSLAESPAPVRIVFDTDIMGDVDDVGSVAALHALADRGEVKILAMGVSAKHPSSPLCLDALNTYFGRPDVPLGVVKGPAFLRDSKYADQIAAEFPHRLKSAGSAPDAAMVYRRVLAKQPDRSVVIVTVGQVTNLRNLLMTKPDQLSDLGGRELVDRKVKLWVCMGGRFPEGREANLVHDGPAAAYAVRHWPTPIVFSGWELGVEVLTGDRLNELPETSPVRRAYQLYNGVKNHKSWDQTAVLYAARGLDRGLSDLWRLESKGHLHVAEDGSNQWLPTPNRDHSYLVKSADPSKPAAAIEELMIHQPAGIEDGSR